jgi:hypothetical protein
MIIAHNRLYNSTDNMDQQEPPEFILDVFADPRSVREVVKGKFTACSLDRLPTLDTHPAILPRDSLNDKGVTMLSKLS